MMQTVLDPTPDPVVDRSYARSDALSARAHRLIPGGAHTYAKGDDQYPERAPGFLVRGEGCHAWDADGNRFIEFGMGLRAVTLGHAYPAVVEAAARQLGQGVNFNRPHPLEVELAEKLSELIPCAEMVKFTKDGSSATTAAVKLARAHTGRDTVAVCADHPFFSYDDWFIGTTAMDAGIPEAVKRLTVRFRYGDLAGLERVLRSERVACVVMEPAKYDDPPAGYLEGVRALCDRYGALLVFDEMITGFRWHLRGAQHVYGVTPDLAAFGKAMANGFSVSALAGRRDVMERGGLRHDGERVFLLSATHGAETHGLAAALATIRVYETEDVIGALHRAGERLAAGVTEAAAEAGVSDHFGVIGRPCNLVFYTHDPEGRPSQPYRTLFLQELLARGVLAPSFVVSYSHTDAVVDETVEAVRGALSVYRRALDEGAEKYLVGPPTQPVFRRYNDAS